MRVIPERSENFQEAFERFERVVDIDTFESYRELLYSFERWIGSPSLTDKQHSALAYEAKVRGISIEDVYVSIAKTRREKWTTSYKKRAEKRGKAVAKKYRGIGKVRIKALNWYVNRGYSANKIQKMLKDRGLGIRRQTLLKIVRELRLKQKKSNAKKYTPKKYRRKRG